MFSGRKIFLEIGRNTSAAVDSQKNLNYLSFLTHVHFICTGKINCKRRASQLQKRINSFFQCYPLVNARLLKNIIDIHVWIFWVNQHDLKLVLWLNRFFFLYFGVTRTVPPFLKSFYIPIWSRSGFDRSMLPFFQNTALKQIESYVSSHTIRTFILPRMTCLVYNRSMLYCIKSSATVLQSLSLLTPDLPSHFMKVHARGISF